MPVAAEYTFSEKKEKVVVHIPLKGTSPKTVDIFVTEKTLKVNFSPYLVDLVLKGEVDSVKHKATVKDGVLVVTLLKKEPNAVWGELVSSIQDKTTLKEVKTQSLAKQAELETELATGRKDRKHDDEKHSLRKQMALEALEKSTLGTYNVPLSGPLESPGPALPFIYPILSQ